jgi:cation diffusion facilitator CzcD-associated flavoprotein CzcO
VVSRPSRDRLANALRSVLPEQWAYNIVRWKNTRMQHWVYRRTRKAPEKVRKHLLDAVRKALGEEALADFSPSYNPWDQRLCLIPNEDLFDALRSGRARVLTAEIDRITAGGVLLKNGEEIPADVLVSATGLELQIMGGIDIAVDGVPFDFAASWSYRGMMCSGLPNLVSVFGYINASWTLRADIVSRWLCRLLNHMRDRGTAVVVPTLEEGAPAMAPRPWIDGFSAGYMQRVMHLFPRQGDRDPWINSQNYLKEKRQFAEMSLDEPALRYEAADAGDGAAHPPGQEAA